MWATLVIRGSVQVVQSAIKIGQQARATVGAGGDDGAETHWWEGTRGEGKEALLAATSLTPSRARSPWWPRVAQGGLLGRYLLELGGREGFYTGSGNVLCL